MRAVQYAIVAGVAVTLGASVAFAQNQQPKADQPEEVREPPLETLQGQNPQSRPTGEEAANGMLGAWEFSDADHNRICHLTFRAEPASRGRRLDVDKNCPNLFPSTKDIAGWALDNYGGLRLLDNHGEAVIELTEVESGMYDGFAPGEGRYVLQTAAAAPVRSADDMVGDWAVARGTGKPICTLTLANSPAAGAVSSGIPGKSAVPGRGIPDCSLQPHTEHLAEPADDPGNAMVHPLQRHRRCERVSW